MRPSGATDPRGRSSLRTIDLEDLGFDRGAHLLVDRALATMSPGEYLAIRGRDANLAIHLVAWARAHGHRVIDGTVLEKGPHEESRWRGAQRAGGPLPGQVAGRAPASWGLAARGALVEEGGPPLQWADLNTKNDVWADIAPKLYAQALAGQWDPATAIDWNAEFSLPPEVEAAVVQVMTYLIENEQAALVVPARFLSRIHPHYREAMQLLAVQVADEARHVEVFTRRALLKVDQLGTSTVNGRASLQTLLDEPDFSLATFLLSVLGEGSFLNLLAFLERHAPDPVTRQVCRLALQDEARHVAFGVAHLEHRVAAEPALVGRLRSAVERRHSALSSTAGLNPGVEDSLILLAAGALTPDAIAQGWDRVVQLRADMHDGRQRRLVRLGFPADEADDLSGLHTKNFM